LRSLQTNSASTRSHGNDEASSCIQPCLDTILQNIRITHGGYKRSLAEGIRQTARRGQTNPSGLLWSAAGFPSRWKDCVGPRQTGIGMASIAKSSNVAKLRAKQYLRKDNTRCAFVLKNASQICRAISVEPLLTNVLKAVSPDSRTLLRLLCWIVPLCYSRSIYTIQPLGGM
jgi:hypothetical protein